MATIAELLAGKVAKPKAAPFDPELTEAINRIDPPGKRDRKPSGLVVSRQDTPPEPRGQRTPVQELPADPQPRNLSETAGECIPLTPDGATAEVAAWHTALQSFETDLCLMRDPSDPETCWLAVRNAKASLPPILIHRLPWLLWDAPSPRVSQLSPSPLPEDLPY